MKHEFHTAPGRPLEPQSREFDSLASPNLAAASPPTRIAYGSQTSTPPPPSHRPPKIPPAHTPSSISCQSVGDRSAGLPMEFPNRPTDRCTPENGSGIGAMGVLKTRNPTTEGSRVTMSHSNLSLGGASEGRQPHCIPAAAEPAPAIQPTSPFTTQPPPLPRNAPDRPEDSGQPRALVHEVDNHTSLKSDTAEPVSSDR